MTLDQSHRAGCTVPSDPGSKTSPASVVLENYHQVKENLEKISDINRELMHRLKVKNKKRKSVKK